ncbi:MAG: YebC/PmpR family DNA-binding transcriptional regulator, partial [Anaerobacillus sp.]
EEAFEIYTDPQEFQHVKQSLLHTGISFSSAEVTMIPETYVSLNNENGLDMLKLIDMLEDNDDVQDVYHNAEVNDEVNDQV